VRGDTLEKRFTFLGSHFLSSMAAKAPRLRNKKRRHEASFGKIAACRLTGDGRPVG